MYDNIFNIDINRWVGQLLPIQKRTQELVHWLLCLVAPLVELHSQFIRFRRDAIYQLQHTPQVFSMEDVLNDSFDNAERRIYITDGAYTSPVLFFDRADEKPVRFHDRVDDKPVYFYDRKLLLDVDFIVVLPQALSLSDAETLRIRALIDFYRLPDKTYELNYE